MQLLHPDDSVAELSFDEKVKVHEDFSNDRERNARGIKEARTGGSTVLYDAVSLALEDVLKPVEIDRKALVLFTGGVDTVSRKASDKGTLELAKETRAVIHCIYFNTELHLASRNWRRARPRVLGIPLPGPPGKTGPVLGPPIPGSTPSAYRAGRDYLSKLAEFSGGVILDALEMEDLGPAFEQIARELASLYSLGYYSTNTKRDGKWRKVEVKMDKPGLIARTKKGYYGPKPGK